MFIIDEKSQVNILIFSLDNNIDVISNKDENVNKKSLY